MAGKRLKLTLEPGKPEIAIDTFRRLGFHRIYHDEGAGLRFDDILDEAAFIGRRFREDPFEVRAVVMVSHQQMVGNGEGIEQFSQVFIGALFAEIGEIAGEDRKGGGRVVSVYVTDRPLPTGPADPTRRASLARERCAGR